jgi:hypothetical protein
VDTVANGFKQLVTTEIQEMKTTILEISSHKTKRTNIHLNHDFKKSASSCETKTTALIQIITDTINKVL